MGSGTSLEYCALSDIGRRRASNQDAQTVAEPYNTEQYRRRGWLLLVADGMGAHAAGEMASALAAQEVPQAYDKNAHRPAPLALRSSLLHANAQIHARGESTAELKGMGTTCTTLVIVPRGALVGHVGDSRAYRIRGGTIEQLSRDHSLAWDMEAAREKAGGEAIPAPPKNIITRSMGPHGRLEVDIEGPFPVEEGDVFVLCSDGLSGQVADEEIGGFAATLPPEEAAAAMLGLALVRGAPDNVTLIVAKAGPKVVTDPATANTPWPLADDEPPNREPAPLPWRTLAIAGAALLGALIIHPLALTHPETGLLGRLLGPGLAEAVGWSVTAGMGLLFVGALVAALVGSMTPPGGTTPTLKPGGRLGNGPYRSYDCTPTPELVEGITASVETAADGLSDRERQKALQHVAATRQAIAAGTLPAALAEAAKAIAVYRQSVEAARRDDTIRI